jgi:hypothetical protein
MLREGQVPISGVLGLSDGILSEGRPITIMTSLWSKTRRSEEDDLDGVIRDLAGVRRTNLPVWYEGTAAPASVAGLTFVGWQMPIACGGVAVFPDDIIVADDDGAVVIPAALLDEVVAVAVEQEKLEAWIIDEVRSGLPLPGLYPPNAETKARYAAFCTAQPNAEE